MMLERKKISLDNEWLGRPDLLYNNFNKLIRHTWKAHDSEGGN